MRPSRAKSTKSSPGSQAPKVESAARIDRPPAVPAPDGRHVSEDEIRLLAYQKWLAAGRPPGDGIEFWHQAEMELRR